MFITSTSRITKAINIHPIAKKWNPLRKTAAAPTSTVTGAPVHHHQHSHQFHSTTRASSEKGQAQGHGGNEKEGGRSGTGKFHKLSKTIPKQWTWRAGAGWTILSVLDWWLLVAGGWLSWQGALLRWTPLGVCLAAAIQWHLHNRDLDKKGLPRTATKWQTNVYCAMPLRLMSRGWGWMAERRIPVPFRPTVYGAYSTAFGVNIHEAMDPDFRLVQGG